MTPLDSTAGTLGWPSFAPATLGGASFDPVQDHAPWHAPRVRGRTITDAASAQRERERRERARAGRKARKAQRRRAR